MTQHSSDAPDRTPFAMFLKQMRKGSMEAELTDALADVVAGVVKHGKQGTITLKITLKPEGDGAVQITDRWDAKVPTPPAKAALFFANDQGQLSRNRLDQPPLPFQAVDGGKTTTEQDGRSEAATS